MTSLLVLPLSCLLTLFDPSGLCILARGLKRSLHTHATVRLSAKKQLLLPFLEMSAVYFLSLLFILRIIYLVTDFNNLDSFFPYKMRQEKRAVSSLGAVSHLARLHTGHRDVIIVISLVLFPPDVTVMRQGIWRHVTGDIATPETEFTPYCPNQTAESTDWGSVWSLVLTTTRTSYTDILMDEKQNTW